MHRNNLLQVRWRGPTTCRLVNVPDAIMAVACCGALVYGTDFGHDGTNVDCKETGASPAFASE